MPLLLLLKLALTRGLAHNILVSLWARLQWEDMAVGLDPHQMKQLRQDITLLMLLTGKTDSALDTQLSILQ